MIHGRNKYQSRENRARVRDLFMREWDPIGVSEIPEASDEYDSYVAVAYVMLMARRASSDAIAAYLLDIATNHMGLSSQDGLAERCARTAAALVALRPEFETH